MLGIWAITSVVLEAPRYGILVGGFRVAHVWSFRFSIQGDLKSECWQRMGDVWGVSTSLQLEKYQGSAKHNLAHGAFKRVVSGFWPFRFDQDRLELPTD